MPLARIRSVSFVLVSPSIETQLYVPAALSRRAFRSMGSETAQSVVTKLSIVPRLILIMPLPLHIAPIVTVLPPISVRTAHSL